MSMCFVRNNGTVTNKYFKHENRVVRLGIQFQNSKSTRKALQQKGGIGVTGSWAKFCGLIHLPNLPLLLNSKALKNDMFVHFT